MNINNIKTDTGKKYTLIIFIISAFSVLLSFYYIHSSGVIPESYGHDEGNYIAMAERMITEGYYSYSGAAPDAYVSPGYPVFLFLCFKAFGLGYSGVLAAKILQVIMFAAVVAMTYSLGRAITGSGSAGTAATILIACNTHFYSYVSALLTEIPFLFFMLAFCLAFCKAVTADKWPLHAVSGVLLACAVMLRPALVVVIIFIYIPYIAQHIKAGRKCAVTWFFVFLAGFAVVCLPWWVRNLVVLGEFIPFATQSNAVYQGLARNMASSELPELESRVEYFSVFIGLLKANPKETITWMTIGKFYELFIQEEGTSLFDLLGATVTAATVLIGNVGIIRGLAEKKLRVYTIALLVYVALTFLVGPVRRYALPFLPFFAIASGWVIISAVKYNRA